MEFASGVANPCAGTLTGPSYQLFMALIHALFGSMCKLGPEGRYPPDYGPNLTDGEEFDFIIVGAGSAGSLLANRLSAVNNWKILLLEAGTYPSTLTEIPTLVFATQDTAEDWQYKTEKSETACLGLTDQVCKYPRGKVLGGSSAINVMLYVQSNKQDHDNWVKAGNTGWDYESALKYYRRFENFKGESDWFGKNGDLDINEQNNNDVTPLYKLLIESYKELGFGDSREDLPIGTKNTYVTITQGTRNSAAKAFLSKIKERENLRVVLNARVSKVLFDETSTSIKGVEVHVNNKVFHLKSRKEVILSAGSINSPQILMNSGIGPKEHLQSLGIEAKFDLKVGENFHDHLMFLGLFMNIDNSLLPQKTENEKVDDIYQYIMHKTGPYAGAYLLNFITHANSKNNSRYPNLQIHHVPYFQRSPEAVTMLSTGFNLPPDLTKIQLENNEKSSNLIVFPTALSSKSTGKILLRSKNPFDKPLIYANYLSDDEDEDVELLLDGIKLIQKMTKTEKFAKANPKLVDLQLPNCKMFKFDTDDYWRCAIRNIATHLHHPVGTCKMGPSSDPTAVVGPNLKVHGIGGIRVIDASIFPKIPSCNTNAPTYMVAEKGAELIKDEWLQKRTDKYIV